MSKLRSLSTAFWSDTFIENQDPKLKLLFIYLLSNEKTNMLGCYEISKAKISFETGISRDEIDSYFDVLKHKNKVIYTEDNFVLMINFLKHQKFNTNMMKSAIDSYNELPENLKIKDTPVITRDSKGFERLCKGFGMVRKVEVEYEVEIEKEDEDEVEPKNDPYDFKILDVSEFKDVRELQKFYLNNLRLMNAFCDNKKNKIKFEDLPQRLEEFTKELESSGRFKETFSEYSTYFKSWNRKVPKKEINKTDNQGRLVANFSNPII